MQALPLPLPLLLLLASSLLLTLGGGRAPLVSGHELARLDELIGSGGLGADKPASERQRELELEIRNLYALSDELHDLERDLLGSLGSAMPDGRQKNQLRVMAAQHLVHAQELARLSAELRRELEQTAGKEQ